MNEIGRDIESTVLGEMLTGPALTCAQVVTRYGAPALKNWREVTLSNTADALELLISNVQHGDLSALEAMLTSQAVALQAMFTTLAQRADLQTNRENIASTMNLALKAQSQSRATIQALIDLKFPRTTAFVKQTNIAHGAQQVNNDVPPPCAPAPAHEQRSSVPNKLLAGGGNGRTIVDTGAARQTGRSNRDMGAMAAVHRPKDAERKSRGRTQR